MRDHVGDAPLGQPRGVRRSEWNSVYSCSKPYHGSKERSRLKIFTAGSRVFVGIGVPSGLMHSHSTCDERM